MIEIKFTGMCEGCTRADLELNGLELGRFLDAETTWAARCKHEDVCKIWAERLEAERE